MRGVAIKQIHRNVTARTKVEEALAGRKTSATTYLADYPSGRQKTRHGAPLLWRSCRISFKKIEGDDTGG
jgi:hypothetical protein